MVRLVLLNKQAVICSLPNIHFWLDDLQDMHY